VVDTPQSVKGKYKRDYLIGLVVVFLSVVHDEISNPFYGTNTIVVFLQP
jgi:hypothetical protein